MPDATTYGLFVLASLALTLVPGPAVLYIVARSVEGGRPAGLVSVLGITTGGLLHTAFAAVGLSAILASSATAFAVVKWVGVAYLVYLGLRRILTPDATTHENAPRAAEPEPPLRIFWQAVLVDLLNPKVALFFLAFLPQFVDPSQGAAWAQILALGLTFAAVGLCTDGLYALLSGTAADWLKRRMSGNAGFRRLQRYLSGSVYLALGAGAAISGSGKD
ncbi:LysE family translocator [Rubrobacter tropicus]|uniref:LysE family translocator n=1 Tax=Rubrobacter tropicus TaxID=2653851 RepID=A0A6G8Q499_9ACTN|nr:LysE family translocator [Rubrobacter tropicus]QIN81270.1 LysE family translocator [Rubrobacter tropicus]